ncbi:hypothetical protein [Methylobacterium flocculans]|uniref:hypothetical protein n=1 Tax=Methylobacterium flocculans TaxID=2984843 RepID=UPI0021F362BE|nr:hypothetical protein [Methylobacterium sp. FF17]
MDDVDITIRRGNNAPAVAWELVDENDAPLLLAGRSLVLTLKWGGGRMRKESTTADGFTVDSTTSTVTWTPSLAESRAIPLGRLSRYEIELRDGDLQITIVAGSVTGVDSLNDD